MHKDEYVQEIVGLDTGSKNRLVAYCKQLGSDKRSTNCDKFVLEVIEKYALSKDFVDDVMSRLRKKDYTQSWYRYSMMETQLVRFTEPDHPWFGWNREYQRVKDELKAEMHKLHLRTLVYRRESDIISAIPRKDTHSGWNYILTGRKSKGDNLEGIFVNYMTEEAKAKEKGYFQKPILVGSRTQTAPPFDPETGEFVKSWSADDKCKSRVVSMIDLYQIIAEAKFGTPFQEALGHMRFYAGGKSDSRINDILHEERWKYDNWLTVDYSHYDQSISSWLIYDAFEIVREAFISDPFFDNDLWEVVKRSFIHKVFVSADVNKPFESHKGVPSGSIFTQIIDTIVNRLMIETYLNSIGVKHRFMMIMGDDNIIFTTEKINEKDLSTYLTKNFGIECNPTKCEWGTMKDAPSFLSRYWTPNGAWRHPAVLLSKMTHPERFRNYNDPVVKLDPLVIVYAYLLTFPMGMRELVDIDRFELDNASKLSSFTKGDLIHGSGSMRYRILYNRI